MSQLSVSGDESSFELIDSSASSTPLNSSMELIDSENQSQPLSTPAPEPRSVLLDLKGYWRTLPNTASKPIIKLQAHPDRIELTFFNREGTVLMATVRMLQAKGAAPNQFGILDYVEDNKWITEYGPVKIKTWVQDGQLRNEYSTLEPTNFYEKLDDDWWKKDNDRKELDDQKKQQKLLEEEVFRLKETVPAILADHQKALDDQKKQQKHLEIEVYKLKAIVQKLQKDQEPLPTLPILQDINGTWKLVSQGKENADNRIGEFLKIKASSEAIQLTRYTPNGVLKTSCKVSLVASTPFRGSSCHNFIVNNQWKTIIENKDVWNMVQSIKDGKLCIEYCEDDGSVSFEDVYERVDGIPIPVLDHQKELEELKDRLKQEKLENETLKTQNVNLKFALDSKEQQIEMDIEKIRHLNSENLNLKKTIANLQLQMDSKNQKCPKMVPEKKNLEKNTDLNGIWKLVAKTGETNQFSPDLMEFTKLKVDSRNNRIKLTMFAANGWFLEEKELFHPASCKLSNDFWSITYGNGVYMRTVVRFTDGKLRISYENAEVFDCKATGTLTFERAQQIPQAPILEEICGNWKLVSPQNGSLSSRFMTRLGIFYKIATTPNRIESAMYIFPGITLFNRTVPIGAKDSPFSNKKKVYVENNSLVSINEEEPDLRVERTLVDGKLVQKVKSDEEDCMFVYERTNDFMGDLERNFLIIKVLGIGAVLCLLIAFFLF